MKKVVIDIVEVIVEVVAIIGLICGSQNIRIACGFLAIGYKLAKTKLDIDKIKC